MASLSAVIDLQSTGYYLDWTVYGLSSGFNTSNYLSAGITSRSFSDGATSISGIIDSNETRNSTSTSTSTSGFIESPYTTPGQSITLYGFAHAANGRYYSAGSTTVTVPYPEVEDPTGYISISSVSASGNKITARVSISGLNYSPSEYGWNLYCVDPNGSTSRANIESAATTTATITIDPSDGHPPGRYTCYVELYYTEGTDVYLDSDTYSGSITISYGSISSFSLSDGGGSIVATMRWSGLISPYSNYGYRFYYQYGNGTLFQYPASGQPAATPSSSGNTITMPVDTSGYWSCWVDLYYYPYSGSTTIDSSGVQRVYITIAVRPNDWSWATTISINGTSFSRVIASGNTVPTFREGRTNASTVVRATASTSGTSRGTLAGGTTVWIHDPGAPGIFYHILHNGSWGYVQKASITLQSGLRAYFMSASEWANFQARINEFRVYKKLDEVNFAADGDVVGSGYAMEPYQFRAVREAIEEMDPPTSPPSTPARYSTISAATINGLATSLNSIK